MSFMVNKTDAQFKVLMNDLIAPYFKQFENSYKKEVADLREELKNSNKKLLTFKDVMERFSISKPTVYAWIELGTLIPYPINGRTYFKAEDIEKLTAEPSKK